MASIKKAATFLFAAAVATAGSVSQPALAADAGDAYAGCTCVTGAPAAGVGLVNSTSGNVIVDNAAGSAGQELFVGSNVEVYAGSANVSVGAECQGLQLGSNSTLSISQPGSALCVKVASDPGAGAGSSTASAGSGISPVLGAVLIGGGIAGIVALNNDDDNNRPSASP